MSSYSIVNFPEANRKFNINWRTFGLISLVMTSLMLCFLWIIAQWNASQFEMNRQNIHLQYQDQLQRLIETSAESMIQLSSAVSFNNGLMEAITNQQKEIYEAELEHLDWNLQTDSGMSLVGLFNLEWQNLFVYGERDHAKAVQDVVNNEQPYRQIDCPNICRIVTYTPLLHQGDIRGVLALAEPLSNVMLRFQRVANINTGLLGEASQSADNLIPSWQRSLMALTNPDESKQIIKRASEDYSLQDLSDGIALINVKDALYELKAMPLQGKQVVVISDVSEDYSVLNQSKGKNLQISAIALVCGELLLLLFLWTPLRKIKMSEQLEGVAVQQAQLIKEKTIALSKAESLSENLCDSMSVAILVLGEGGTIEFANNNFIRMSGYSYRNIKGHCISEFVLGDRLHSERRIADVYDGSLDEYEHIARIESRTKQVHKMIWRYVPSYYTGEEGIEGDDTSSNTDRSIVAIGVPIALPTLESEQIRLNSFDPQTGMLNKAATYEVIDAALSELRARNVESNTVSIIYLYRFDDAAFESKLAEQEFLKVLSVFAVEANNLTDISKVRIGRVDTNEIIVSCCIESNQDQRAIELRILQLIENLAARFNSDLSICSAFLELTKSECKPHAILQDLYRKLYSL